MSAATVTTGMQTPTPQERLAQLAEGLRVRGVFYSRGEFSAPWAVELPAMNDAVSFHLVTEGTCLLDVGDGEVHDLRAGDLALVPHGRGHILRDHDYAASAPVHRVDLLPQRHVGEHYSELTFGGGGESTNLICGIVDVVGAEGAELARGLPGVLFIRADQASADVRAVLDLMAGELSQARVGGPMVAARLADIVVVQSVRQWIDEADAPTVGWVAAARSEPIGRAIEAMHGEPGADWSVVRLARVAAMSRSSFSARFADLMGQGPMQYLTRWRMELARERLAVGDETTAKIGADLGYRSEAAFHRAFRRHTGQTPSAARRTARAAPPFVSPISSYRA